MPVELANGAGRKLHQRAQQLVRGREQLHIDHVDEAPVGLQDLQTVSTGVSSVSSSPEKRQLQVAKYQDAPI